MNKYPDYFTEYEIPDIINFKEISNINLYKHIPNPFNKGKTKKELALEYFYYYARGKEHILFKKYQEKYGVLGMSTNLVVPYIDEYNKTINDIIILCHPDDCERIAKNHLKKNPHFKLVMADSVISTTDNEHWNVKSNLYNHYYQINTIKNIIWSIVHISQLRAKECSKILLNKIKKHRNRY